VWTFRGVCNARDVLFYFWRELYIFYFGLEFWPNYTGPIIWCPTCVMETRIYSFILFWIFSFVFTSFHISLIGFGLRRKKGFWSLFPV